MSAVLKRVAWVLNTGGLLVYLVWLALPGHGQILREQDGIVYFLPVIPFFFVYMLLIEPKKKAAGEPMTEGKDAGAGGKK